MTPEEKEVVWRVFKSGDALKVLTRLIRLESFVLEARDTGDSDGVKYWTREIQSEKNQLNSLLDSL